MSTITLTATAQRSTLQRSTLHHSDKPCNIAMVPPDKDIQHRHHPCVVINKARIH